MTTYVNPLATLNLTKDDYKTTRIIGNAYLNLEILKGLSLRTNLGVDKGAETNDYFQSGQVTGTAGQTTGTSKSADNGSYTAEANLTYAKTYKDHTFEALAGYSIQEYSGTSNTLTGLGFASDRSVWRHRGRWHCRPGNDRRWRCAPEAHPAAGEVRQR